MSFVKKFKTLIKKSDDSLIEFNMDKGITITSFNPNHEILYSKKIFAGDYSFVDTYFDIDENDAIYGLINSIENSLIYVTLRNNNLTKTPILKFNPSLYSIKFPYIKKDRELTHVIFFRLNQKDKRKTCSLIHYFKENNQWIKTEISSVFFNILSNYSVVCSKNYLRIFYLSIINGTEEVFVSTFDINRKVWSYPLQITNSHRGKVYISVVNSSDSLYHIVLSENNFNHYHCTNINVFFNGMDCTIYSIHTICETVACTFPHLILYEDKLYAQWIEYHDLYTSHSEDLGETWGTSKLSTTSYKYPFVRYDYKCNSKINKDHVLSTIFTLEDSPSILGVPFIN